MKALVALVREDVEYMARQNARLVALPERHIQQVSMVLHEGVAHHRVAQQEGAEGLRKDIPRPHAVPDLARHFLFFGARRGHTAEVAVSDVLDLVVVVEDHLAVARHAEVLPQHVAGKDVGGHQVLDRVAVLDDDALDLLAGKRCRALRVGLGPASVERFLQIDVERNHAPLDVDMLDDDFDVAITVAVTDIQLARRKPLDLGNQIVLETVARKTDAAVLQRVGHAPNPVMLLDQQVLALDLLARGVLLRRIEVLDELEHIGEGRQVEHQHHHAFDPGSDAELVRRVAQVVQEIAVEQGLALLGQSERVVDLVARLARHHAVQVLHVGRRNLHIDHEVGAGKTEQHQQVVFAEQGRVDHQFAAAVMQHRQRKRKLVETVDQLADDVAALVAEEQARQHLNLKIGAQFGVGQARQHGGLHQRCLRLQLLEWHTQVEVPDQLHEHFAHVAGRRVVGAVGRARLWLAVLDVLGADRRAHKDEFVLEIAAVQNLGRDRVEEGLGQFRLVVIDQQADVMQLDLLPDVHRLRVGLEFTLQPVRALAHAQVVKLDAIALRALLAVPVGGLEPVLGARRLGPEQPVVPIEAIKHGFRNIVGERRVKALREHNRPLPNG